ncbi:MAG TPA: hypothetical protein VK658_04640 [Chryseolinea sp.]|nr:hypothetical protein [Chryseolinea sp.]
MKHYIHAILFCFAAAGLTSCSEEENPQFDKDTFTKIYDNNKFNSSNFAIDMRQTPDGGFLILGGRIIPDDSIYTGIYLMKVDEFGNFVREIEVDGTSVNPVASLATFQTKYYFVCTDRSSLQAQVASVDANLEAVTITPVQGGLSYPAAASFIDNNFVVVGYNNVDRLTTMSIVSPEGGVLAYKGFMIEPGDAVEQPIMDHFVRTGRKFPFAVGKAPNGMYYFNGFYNYTFSLVFTDMVADDPNGVVQGSLNDGGFSAITPISGNKFAAARFNFGDNYLMPNREIPTSGISSSSKLGGYSLPEMVANAKVRIVRATVDQKNILIYGTDTKSKQIGLLYYNESTGEFINSRYLGFSNPFEIVSMTQTEDEGLAVCGMTQVAGRFGRITVFKISKEQLQQDVAALMP